MEVWKIYAENDRYEITINGYQASVYTTITIILTEISREMSTLLCKKGWESQEVHISDQDYIIKEFAGDHHLMLDSDAKTTLWSDDFERSWVLYKRYHEESCSRSGYFWYGG